jgi:ATP-dependent DNA helicase RecG
MNKKQLLKLIERGESETLELKPSLSQINEIIETISALSNKSGGRIIVGISSSGKMFGVRIGKDTVERLTNKITANTEPKAYPKISVEEINKKKIIVIEVNESRDKPVLAFGRAFKRVGKSTLKMSKDEIEKSILEGKRVYWDEQICEKASLKNIDWDFVKEFFIKKYEKITNKKLKSSPKVLLKALDCIKNNKPTNAGILLFGKYPQKFFPNTYIALAKYKGEEVGTERLDYKKFVGNLFQQVDSCNEYMKRYVATLSRLIPGKIEREDIPQYPYFAIRELIVNAVCHRNYEDQTSKIIIKMFSDRIEYYSPGGLPKGITPNNIIEMQKSRNPTIAKIFAKVKYIEELGEGWDRITEEYKAHPLNPKMPVILDFKEAVIVKMFAAKLDWIERFKDKLNERQVKIIEYLKFHESIKSEEYAKMFNISDRQARSDLSKLISFGLLVKRGKARQITYFLNPEISGNIRKYNKSLNKNFVLGEEY